MIAIGINCCVYIFMMLLYHSLSTKVLLRDSRLRNILSNDVYLLQPTTSLVPKLEFNFN